MLHTIRHCTERRSIRSGIMLQKLTQVVRGQLELHGGVKDPRLVAEPAADVLASATEGMT